MLNCHLFVGQNGYNSACVQIKVQNHTSQEEPQLGLYPDTYYKVCSEAGKASLRDVAVHWFGVGLPHFVVASHPRLHSSYSALA